MIIKGPQGGQRRREGRRRVDKGGKLRTESSTGKSREKGGSATRRWARCDVATDSYIKRVESGRGAEARMSAKGGGARRMAHLLSMGMRNFCPLPDERAEPFLGVETMPMGAEGPA